MQPAPEPDFHRLLQEIQTLRTELAASRAREQAAREPYQGHLDALNNVKDACAVFDREGRIAFVNRSAEALCRRTREELLGRTVAELFPVLGGSPLLEAVSEAAQRRESVRFEQSYPEVGVWLE